MQGSSTAATTGAARPYGLMGLAISTLVIALTAALLTAIVGLTAFGVLIAVVGWPEALHRFTALAPDGKLSGPTADRLNLVVGALLYAVTGASVLIVARFRGGRDWTKLVGWNAWSMQKNARLIALLLAATLTWSLIASSIIEHLYEPAKDWVVTPTGTPWIIGFLALATVFAPITEELLFRGWIMTSLRDKIGVRFAIVVSALFFAIAHWESTHLYAVAVFPVGLALGYARQRADSVAASITLHALYNGVAAVLLFATR